MIQTYSKNVFVDADTPIPLNSVSLIKGDSVTKQGATTLQFNCRGIYEVCVNAIASVETIVDDENISIQLQKDDVLQPQAVSAITPIDVEPSVYPLSFVTLVQVTHDNGPCCCSNPTNINIINTGMPATFDTINVVVTKIC